MKDEEFDPAVGRKTYGGSGSELPFKAKPIDGSWKEINNGLFFPRTPMFIADDVLRERRELAQKLRAIEGEAMDWNLGLKKGASLERAMGVLGALIRDLEGTTRGRGASCGSAGVTAHWCGCETYLKKGVVHFTKKCNRGEGHQNWIAIQALGGPVEGTGKLAAKRT